MKLCRVPDCDQAQAMLADGLNALQPFKDEELALVDTSVIPSPEEMEGETPEDPKSG
jgi:hypothetical protein